MLLDWSLKVLLALFNYVFDFDPLLLNFIINYFVNHVQCCLYICLFGFGACLLDYPSLFLQLLVVFVELIIEDFDSVLILLKLVIKFVELLTDCTFDYLHHLFNWVIFFWWYGGWSFVTTRALLTPHYTVILLRIFTLYQCIVILYSSLQSKAQFHSHSEY